MTVSSDLHGRAPRRTRIRRCFIRCTRENAAGLNIDSVVHVAASGRETGVEPRPKAHLPRPFLGLLQRSKLTDNRSYCALPIPLARTCVAVVLTSHRRPVLHFCARNARVRQQPTEAPDVLYGASNARDRPHTHLGHVWCPWIHSQRVCTACSLVETPPNVFVGDTTGAAPPRWKRRDEARSFVYRIKTHSYVPLSVLYARHASKTIARAGHIVCPGFAKKQGAKAVPQPIHQPREFSRVQQEDRGGFHISRAYSARIGPETTEGS